MPSSVLPPTWCAWSEWSHCSAEPCHSGYALEAGAENTAAINSSIYCLDRLGVGGAVSSVSIDGTLTSIKPQKIRRRICNCKLYNILRAIFSRCGKQNLVEVSCKSCSSPERVYHDNNPIMRLCSDIVETSTSNNLYHIIGGSLGVLAFLMICVFCIRFAVAESSRINRRQRRRRTELNENRNCTTVSEFSRFPIELPPAYKDVIPLPGVGSVPILNSETPPSVFKLGGSIRNLASSDMRNLPPTYQEVIAVSPTAAEMHQSVLQAQCFRTKVEEEVADGIS